MEQLARETAVFGINLSSQQLDQFAQYQALLLTWNQRLNLTAVRQPEQIQRRHFLDALTCASVMNWAQPQTIIDVGTGAGFPGLPLKILSPHLSLILVESIAKKARHLETVVAELNLTNVSVVVERAEVVGQDDAFRGRFDWAVARAVAELRVLAEYLLPLCRVGGHMLAQKGERAATETAAAKQAIALLGGGTPTLHPVQLPQRDKPSYLILVEKLAETPAKYPRRVGVPGKRPL